jgi:hypothetical protein
VSIGKSASQTHETVSSKIKGKTTYSGFTDPRPKDRGWWGAFGHVVVNANYSDITIRNYSNGYSMIKAQVDYTVDDTYTWYGGEKTTPLPLGDPYWNDGKLDFYTVDIPHDWEDSLVASGDGIEYDFNIYWSDTLIITVDPTFSWLALGGNRKYEVLRLK